MADQSSETAPTPALSTKGIITDQYNADTTVEVDENDREKNEQEGIDTNPAKQCRICLDGDEDSALGLGRLIRPCLCKGSMTVLVIAALSAFLFTLLVLAASFVTTSISIAMDNPSYGYGFSYGYGYGFGWGYYDPWEVARDLVRAAIRILKDEPLFDESIFRSVRSAAEGMRDGAETAPPAEMGLVGRLLRRFVLGLPVVGAGSLIHMLLSFPLLGPVQWLARRGNRNRGRRGDSRDMAAMVVLALLLAGAIRALVKVYSLTQELTQRALARAEDAILEVD
ncbi:hypothetical protein HWV62_23739 [Athelia sp. TMB]|nr:hypothetical protein HWV62_23739 [Athelia sp. TMB]